MSVADLDEVAVAVDVTANAVATRLEDFTAVAVAAAATGETVAAREA